MRRINYLVLHCTATPEGRAVSVAEIDSWHRARGFRTIGYHYVVGLDGTIGKGRDDSEAGAHVAGHNGDSIGICYVGGLDAAGRPKDTRTPAQRTALLSLLRQLRKQYPKALILGHRDFSPDLNGNGIVEPSEWIKACPCFDAKEAYEKL